MQSANDLKQLLFSINHKSYPAYKSTRGAYQFPRYTLSIDHAPGDPFAAPSRVSVHISGKTAAFPAFLYDTYEKRVALQDYLLRQFARAIAPYSFRAKGSGKSGLLGISRCGQEILERLFKGENLEFSEKGLVNVLQNFEAESIEDIYAKVGEGLVTGWDVLKAVYPAYKQSKLEKVVKSIKVPSFKKVIKKDKKSEPLKIKGLIPGMAVHFAGCCHPLPGDRIVGIVTTGKGVAVHTIDCKALE